MRGEERVGSHSHVPNTTVPPLAFQYTHRIITTSQYTLNNPTALTLAASTSTLTVTSQRQPQTVIRREGQKYTHVILPKTSLLIAAIDLLALVSKPEARVLRCRTKSCSAAPFTYPNNVYTFLPKLCGKDICCVAVKNPNSRCKPIPLFRQLNHCQPSNKQTYTPACA